MKRFRGILPLARELELPIVATNDVHYLRQGDAAPHDVLLCIGTGKTVNDADRLRYHGDQFYLKTAQEMAAAVKPTCRHNTMPMYAMVPTQVPHLVLPMPLR